MRTCDHCHQELDADKKLTARFCDSSCKAAFHRAANGDPQRDAILRFWTGYRSVRRRHPPSAVRSRPQTACRAA